MTGSAFTRFEHLFSETAPDSVRRMNLRVHREKESKLIAAILAGDTQLYHQLIRPYERSVYTMSLSYMKNEKDAEDVAQEAFLSAFRNLRAFRGDLKFSTWLIRIASNEARNGLRRKAAIRIASLDEPRSEEMPVSPALLRGWRELPSAVVECEETRKLIQHAIEMLPNICQQVFLLRDVEKLDVNDTAQILNLSTSQVKVRLHRARMILQGLLAPKLEAIYCASKGSQVDLDL
jgi:RNA polymerase sigma-70 factor, ECF subfamily